MGPCGGPVIEVQAGAHLIEPYQAHKDPAIGPINVIVGDAHIMAPVSLQPEALWHDLWSTHTSEDRRAVWDQALGSTISRQLAPQKGAFSPCMGVASSKSLAAEYECCNCCMILILQILCIWI